jgi:hypothetical protein
MLAVQFKMKSNFFDRPEIEKALGRARVKSLSKAGSFVRRRARSSLRRRKKSSAPGSPPSTHAAGGHSLKTILFAYDKSSDSVMVGPIEFNQRNETVSGFTTTVPGLHERGESAVIFESRKVTATTEGKWRRVDGRRKPRPGEKIEYRKRRAQYPKRPFMRPALEAEAPNFPDLFANSIKK